VKSEKVSAPLVRVSRPHIAVHRRYQDFSQTKDTLHPSLFTLHGVRAVATVAALALAACTSSPPRPGEEARAPRHTPGGYYLDDGPGANAPADLDRVPDARPRMEPIKASTARPYTVFGRTYTPMTRLGPYKARGVASWYGRRYHGQLTASGDRYDMYAMSAAHPTLPIPSYARVTHARTGKAVTVRINDRGPFRGERLIDLSYTAAYKLGMLGSGSDLVEVESIIPGDAAPPPAVRASPGSVQAASAPPAEPARAAIAEEPSGTYVQLGAFGQRQNAEAFLGHMRAEIAWLSGELGLYARDGVFRVHAGPYPDRAQADRVASRIEQTMDLRPVLLTR
jgi:rare lipoprotein A